MAEARIKGAAVQRVDVVIVNWNSGTQLARCVDSLGDAEEEEQLNVILVDNASEDGSLVANSTGTVIANSQNLGFAVACNQGAAAGTAPYILFLNPDTIVRSGAVSRAVSALEANSRLGVAGVQLRDEEEVIQRSCARQPDVRMFLCHAVGLTRLWPASGYLMSEWDHAQDRNVEHVIGAFYLIRRELFESLGGFDERFFLYLEDLDLSRRVLAAGYLIGFLASINIMHVGGGTSSQIPDTRLYLALRARITFARKHFAGAGRLLLIATTLVIEPVVRLLSIPLRPQAGSARNTLRAYGQLYRWLIR